MRSLLAPTEDFIKIERTELAADATAGSNVTLTLQNNNQCAENTFIAVGREGSDKAELQKINQAVTPGQSVRVATLLFNHKAGEPVTVYRFDKRKFYGSTTEDGTYAELTDDGSPVIIQVDDPQGTTIEYTGVEGYTHFKATYYNSVTLEETDADDSEAVAGDQTGRYASIYGIRKMAGFTENRYITDGRVEDKRRQAENEINSAIFARYTLPLSEVPPMITYVCECLAAGYMHYEEYGPEGEAVKKLGEARGILKAIQDGRQVLLGSDYTELPSTNQPNMLIGKPNGSETGSETSKFQIGQKF